MGTKNPTANEVDMLIASQFPTPTHEAAEELTVEEIDHAEKVFLEGRQHTRTIIKEICAAARAHLSSGEEDAFWKEQGLISGRICGREFVAASPEDVLAYVRTRFGLSAGWRPIETAPKDGTTVTVCWNGKTNMGSERVSPERPQAVAEGIEDLVKALETIAMRDRMLGELVEPHSAQIARAALQRMGKI